MLTQKQTHAIRVREVLTGNNLFWLELSFPRERRASFATSFRTMKNYLQSSGVILLKDQEYENLDHVDG